MTTSKATTFEMICVGDELLEGRVSDANAAFLGRHLDGALRRVTMVTDQIEDVVNTLEDANSDVVIVSGGLGPTEDDRTRIAAAQFCNQPLVLDAASEAAIRQRLESVGIAFTENNTQQAMFPQGAEVLPNDVGTAPGFALTVTRADGRCQRLLFGPGVPREFAWFVEQYVGPEGTNGLSAQRDEEQQTSRVFSFFGLGESALETNIADVVAGASAAGGKVGFCARFPVIEVKLTGAGTWVQSAGDIVTQRLSHYLIGVGDETLAARVGARLLANGETVTTAESCTAGGIAAMLTDVPGSSSWFERAYVTYANAAKVEELDVDLQALKEYGAVSEVVVRQMALGAQERARATYALAVSGIAGPGGGTDEKPVGTVHFALATPYGVEHRRALFKGRGRSAVRELTKYTALRMLLQHLESKKGE